MPSPNPGTQRDILTGVAAISDNDVWVVDQQTDSAETWHTLAEHWDDTSWSVVPTVDSGTGGNEFYGVHTVASNSVYAVGDESGSSFPDQALIEHWDGSTWSVLPSPADSTESLEAFGVTGSDSALTVAGNREDDTAPFTTFAASAPLAACRCRAHPTPRAKTTCTPLPRRRTARPTRLGGRLTRAPVSTSAKSCMALAATGRLTPHPTLAAVPTDSRAWPPFRAAASGPSA